MQQKVQQSQNPIKGQQNLITISGGHESTQASTANGYLLRGYNGNSQVRENAGAQPGQSHSSQAYCAGSQQDESIVNDRIRNKNGQEMAQRGSKIGSRENSNNGVGGV